MSSSDSSLRIKEKRQKKPSSGVGRGRHFRRKIPLQHLNHRVQDADEKFFESFSALQWKLENTKRQLTAFQKGDDQLNIAKEARKLSIKFGQMTKLSQKELENLYVEVLYTIRHKVGAAVADASETEALYDYAQESFRISPPEDQRLRLIASKEKPPVLVLNVIVIEAQNLVAKDANGFSDPYCMLGVIPGTRSNEVLEQDTSPAYDAGLEPTSPERKQMSPAEDEQKDKSLPSTGHEEWYSLQGRTLKSKVCGRIRLKLWLGTREERLGEEQEDNLIDVKQHESLIRVFSEHELRKFSKEPRCWSGRLPSQGQTILHQHAVQGDITSLQQAMCHWLAYSKIHLDNHLDWKFIHRILEDLLTAWTPTVLSKDEEDMLAESFSEFLTHCYDILVRHRDLLPAWDKENTIAKLENLLKCLTLLHSSELFKKCLPFQRELVGELHSLIKYDQDSFSTMAYLVTVVNAGCSKALKIYHEPFKKAANINYFLLTYKEFDRLVASDLDSQLPGAQQEVLLSVFELYLALSEFFGYKEYLPESDRGKLRTSDYSKWFESAITRWLTLAKEKTMQRVDRACQLDKRIDVSKTEAQHSTSYVDVCFTLQQITEFWERLDLPNVRKNAELTEQLVQSLCKSAEYYADKVFAFLAHSGYFDGVTPLDDTIVQQLCITVNNAEQARRIITDLPDKLHFDDLRNKIQSSQIEMALNRNIESRKAILIKHVFHLAWSPRGCAAELAAKPLLEEMDSFLINYHRWLLHRNFVRFLLAQLRAVLSAIQETVNENLGREPEFYRRLFDSVGILVDFFHADGKGVALDSVQELKVYQSLMNILSLNQTDTVQLIDQFYGELLKEQDNVTECKYGILNVRAYYNATAANLVVDGSITRKQHATLTHTVVAESTMIDNPSPGSMLHFIVMDHDFLLSNDFAGEAFLDLADVPGVRSSNTPTTLRQFNLILMHPSSKDIGPYSVLESRKDDKEAQEFVKHIDCVRNT